MQTELFELPARTKAPRPAILHTLRRVGYHVDRITDGTINMGGCAVYAAAVGAALQAKSFEVEICIADYRGCGVEPAEARRVLIADGIDPEQALARDWVKAGVDFFHLGVRFKIGDTWYTHDTRATRKSRTGFGRTLNDKPFRAFETGLTVAEAQRIAGHAEGWNRVFNRSAHLQRVQRAVRTTIILGVQL